MIEQRGFIQLASSNAAGFINASSNDLLIYTTSNSQKIMIGTQNTNAAITVTSNVVGISGDINFTGTLRQNGVLFQSGGGGGVGWASNATSGTIFTMSNVGVGTTNPVAPFHIVAQHPPFGSAPGYTATASAEIDFPRRAAAAIDGVIHYDFWTNSHNYWLSSGTYTGGVYSGGGSTTFTSTSGGTVVQPGEWWQLKLPTQTVITSMRFAGMGVGQCALVGAVDDSLSWQEILTVTNGNFPMGSEHTLTFAHNTTAFLYYRFIIITTVGGIFGSGKTALSEVAFFGNAIVSTGHVLANTIAATHINSSLITYAGGTAVAPSLTFNGDTDTGVFRPVADTLALTTGGVERMRLTANGNIGIGTSNPIQRLQVLGNVHMGPNTDSNAEYYLNCSGQLNIISDCTSSDNGHVGLILGAGAPNSIRSNFVNIMTQGKNSIFVAPNQFVSIQPNLNTYSHLNSPPQALTVLGSGYFSSNLGVGITNPIQKLHVMHSIPVSGIASSNVPMSVMRLERTGTTNAAYPAVVDFRIGRNSNAGIVHEARTMLQIAMTNASVGEPDVTPVTILSTGNVGIGTSNAVSRLHVNGGISLINGDAGAGSTFTTNQITMGYIGSDEHRHAIRTRHRHDANNTQNAIDFYIWQSTDGNNAASKQVLSVTSTGVGIGTLTPTNMLDVAGDTLVRNTLTVGTDNTSTTLGTEGGKIVLGGTYSDTPGSTHNVIVSRLYGATENSELLIFKGNDAPGDRIRLRAGSIAFDTYSGNTLDYSTNNVRMIINDNGNVGIGTNTPTNTLEVAGTVRINGTFTTGIPTSEGVYIGNYGTGRPGIEMVGATDAIIDFTTINNDTRGRIYYAHNTDSMVLRTAATDRLIINGTGNVGIGTASPTERLHVNGKILAADDITAFSDSNYKTNLEPISGAMDIIESITGYKYNMIDDAPDSKKHVGVLAQQVETLLPEVVHTGEDGKKSVAYGNMIALLIQGMKEMKKEIQELKSIISINAV